MKIAMIIHSKSGNSYHCGQQIQTGLVARGHSVDLIRINAEGDQAMDPSLVTIKNLPDIASYDGLIFGAPVRGFTASAVIQATISALPNFGQRPVYCFVSQFFPFASMGGRQALSAMLAACQAKGAHPMAGPIINWTSPRRRRRIQALTEHCCQAF